MKDLLDAFTIWEAYTFGCNVSISGLPLHATLLLLEFAWPSRGTDVSGSSVTATACRRMGEWCLAPRFLNTALVGVEWLASAQVAFPRGNDPWYPKNTRLGGPQSRSGCRKRKVPPYRIPITGHRVRRLFKVTMTVCFLIQSHTESHSKNKYFNFIPIYLNFFLNNLNRSMFRC